MTSKAWKAREGRLCKIFGGKRRGADYVDEHGKGKNDCVDCKGWSIETKLMLRPQFGKIEGFGKQIKDPIDDIIALELIPEDHQEYLT